MNTLTPIENPDNFEKLIVGLSKKADKLEFDLSYEDVSRQRIGKLVLIDTNNNTLVNEPEIGLDAKFKIDIRAIRQNRVFFSTCLIGGEKSELLLSVKEDSSKKDANCFADYVFLLLKDHHITKIPVIQVNGTLY